MRLEGVFEIQVRTKQSRFAVAIEVQVDLHSESTAYCRRLDCNCRGRDEWHRIGAKREEYGAESHLDPDHR